MMIDSAEVVSLELQVLGFLWNKGDRHKNTNCSFVLVFNPCILTFFFLAVAFFLHHYGVSIGCFLMPCVKFHVKFKKKGGGGEKEKRE